MYLHSLSNKQERDLIDKSAISVLKSDDGVYRLSGMLNVSRSIGDLEFSTIQKTDISIVPFKGFFIYLLIYAKIGSEKFLILATDGFWEIIDNEKLTSLLTFNENNATSLEIIQNISEYIQKKGEDNASFILVFY